MARCDYPGRADYCHSTASAVAPDLAQLGIPWIDTAVRHCSASDDPAGSGRGPGGDQLQNAGAYDAPDQTVHCGDCWSIGQYLFYGPTGYFFYENF